MFIQTKKFIPYDSKLNVNAKRMRQNLTAAERKLWFEYLREHKYRFVRQKVVGNYILDFYCQKLKLGIELDGETHLGNKNEEYDKKRTEELKKYGIKILRFWNYDVLSGLGALQSIIEKEIKKALLRKEG
jgi:very-short-patch-repair endonuclease